ncbi:MAG TPA: zinc ribbon domain-containing protein [Actinomycetota bacterium]|nr:zinc ribbon domain-containing protein [Actinomycetota bacterium]
MPTYEYRCGSCGVTFESRRAIAHADAPIRCPQGHENAVRRPSVFAVTSSVTAERAPLPAGTGCGPGCGCTVNG